MVETVSGIPVVDFSAMSVEHEAIPLPSDDRVQTIVRQIHEAFSTVGFVYLKNHGITQERVIYEICCSCSYMYGVYLLIIQLIRALPWKYTFYMHIIIV